MSSRWGWSHRFPRGSRPGNQNQAGDIAEIVVFDRGLTDTERQGVEAYLAEKYSIRYQQKWRSDI
jgi:hypothetical protein